MTVVTIGHHGTGNHLVNKAMLLRFAAFDGLFEVRRSHGAALSACARAKRWQETETETGRKGGLK